MSYKEKTQKEKNNEDKIPFEIKIKLDGEIIKPSTYVKYLGVFIDSNLDWTPHIDNLSTKLSRAIGMLAKIRYYVSNKVLTSIYSAIFSSLMIYGSQIWGQSDQNQVKIRRLQDKALRIINYKPSRYPVNHLYKR